MTSGGFVESDTHMALWQAESAALAETPWEAWAKEAESLFGRSLDGEQSEDGYSLDGFYDLWKAGKTPERAVAIANAGNRGIEDNGDKGDTLTPRQKREVDVALRHLGRAMKALGRADLPDAEGWSDRSGWVNGLQRGLRKVGEASDTLIDALEEMAAFEGHGK